MCAAVRRKRWMKEKGILGNDAGMVVWRFS